MTWRTRVRAAVMIAATWALAWGLAGALLYGSAAFQLKEYQRARIVGHYPWLTIPTLALLICGVLGLASGLIFSLYLSAAERRNNSGRFSIVRFALCGALAGLCVGLPGLILNSSAALLPAIIGASLGAVSATGTLLIARRSSIGASTEARGRLT